MTVAEAARSELWHLVVAPRRFASARLVQLLGSQGSSLGLVGLDGLAWLGVRAGFVLLLAGGGLEHA